MAVTCISAHPAAQTPIDSGVCESFRTQCLVTHAACPGAHRRSARRRQGLATPATRVRRAAPLSSWRAGHERQSVSGSGSGSAGPSALASFGNPFFFDLLMRIGWATRCASTPKPSRQWRRAGRVSGPEVWIGPPPPLLCYYYLRPVENYQWLAMDL